MCHQQRALRLPAVLQVAAALATYATFCVPGCAATGSAANPHLASPETAAGIMSATQQHAGLLLHVASDQQVSHHLRHTVYVCPIVVNM